MPITLPNAAMLPISSASLASDEERWRMFVRASLMGRVESEGGAVQAYRRIFAGLAD